MQKLQSKILRGSGGDISGGNGTTRKFLGTIDLKDSNAVDALTSAFCKQYASSEVENMLVITSQGEVHFMTDNNPKGVDCSYLGDKLKGSYNIHTHPPDSTQFSFSTDVDLPAFFEDGSAVMEAVDYKYRYRFERPDGITWEQWETMRVQVENEKGSLLVSRGIEMDNYEENVKHIIIDETCRRLGIKAYSREKLR